MEQDKNWGMQGSEEGQPHTRFPAATFSAVAAEWIEAKRQLVKHSSVCNYNLIVNNHLLPLFGEATMVTESDGQKMVLDKLASGMSRKSVKDILATLKAIIRYGEKHCGFPGGRWEIAFPTDTARPRLPVLALAHHRKLLRHLTGGPTSQNIGVLLSLTTGMRIGEVCGLRWRDVDLRHRTITVSRTVSSVYNVDIKATEKIIATPKTRSSNREIPIGRELYAALRSIKGSATPEHFVCGNSTAPKEPRTYREYFYRLLRRLGIPHIVFHGLRHTFATRCIECMCDYKTVSAILGHSNVATTMNLYVHPSQDQKKRAVDRLSRFIDS